MLKPLKKILLVVFAMAISATVAEAHEWTINGNKVKAQAVDLNETHVLLQDNNGNRKAVALNSLADRDVQRLSNLVNVASARQNMRYQKENFRAQQISAMSRLSPAWRVSMMARNGATGVRTYFADNSRAASIMARRQFPNARILNIAKQSGSSYSGSRTLLPRANYWPFPAEVLRRNLSIDVPPVLFW